MQFQSRVYPFSALQTKVYRIMRDRGGPAIMKNGLLFFQDCCWPCENTPTVTAGFPHCDCWIQYRKECTFIYKLNIYYIGMLLYWVYFPRDQFYTNAPQRAPHLGQVEMCSCSCGYGTRREEEKTPQNSLSLPSTKYTMPPSYACCNHHSHWTAVNVMGEWKAITTPLSSSHMLPMTRGCSQCSIAR